MFAEKLLETSFLRVEMWILVRISKVSRFDASMSTLSVLGRNVDLHNKLLSRWTAQNRSKPSLFRAKRVAKSPTSDHHEWSSRRCQEWIPGQADFCEIAGQKFPIVMNSHEKLQRFLLCVLYDFTGDFGAEWTSRGLVPLNDLPEVEEAPRSPVLMTVFWKRWNGFLKFHTFLLEIKFL